MWFPLNLIALNLKKLSGISILLSIENTELRTGVFQYGKQTFPGLRLLYLHYTRKNLNSINNYRNLKRKRHE